MRGKERRQRGGEEIEGDEDSIAHKQEDARDVH